MELLFLIGLAYAASRAVEALRQPASAQWAKHKAARKGTSPADRAKARAARAAVAGYWAGEISRGLPHARHGWAKGWSEHKLSRAEAERDHARVAADHETRLARVRAEMAAHRHRLQVARLQNSRPPTMTEQLEAERRRWYPDGDPYNPGGKQNGGHPMRSQDCTDPDCPCHDSDPPIPGTGNVPVNHRLQEAWDRGGLPPDKRQNGNDPNRDNPGGNPVTDNGSGGDFNYDSTVQLCDELTAAAEQAANDPSYTKAQALSDELGGMLNNDSGALSLAASVTRAAQAGRDAAAQLQEDAEALKSHIVSNYGPIKEAVDSSAGTAPEKEFVDS